MKKRVLAAVMAGMSAMALLSGCGSSSGSSTGASSEDAGELNVFVWTEYVPESVFDTFEEETGIKVNVSTYSSNEDMLAKFKSETEGTYDVLLPSDYMVQLLTEQGLLEELDQEKLTNLSNIGEQYLDPSYDPGNVYSVPYQGGVTVIVYDSSKITTELKGYGDLFDPSLAGTEVLLDDYRAVIGMTERSMGLSMNETDPDTLAGVKDKLLTIKDNVKLYDSDSPKSALISGDCTVGMVWSAEAALAMDENPNLAIAFPEEGAYVFMDNWVIPKGCKNYDNAMTFLNYMLDADTAVAVSSEFPYLQPNTAAIELLGEEFASNEAKNVPAAVIESGEYVENLDSDTLEIYNQMWTELKQ